MAGTDLLSRVFSVPADLTLHIQAAATGAEV